MQQSFKEPSTLLMNRAFSINYSDNRQYREDNIVLWPINNSRIISTTAKNYPHFSSFIFTPAKHSAGRSAKIDENISEKHIKISFYFEQPGNYAASKTKTKGWVFPH